LPVETLRVIEVPRPHVSTGRGAEASQIVSQKKTFSIRWATAPFGNIRWLNCVRRERAELAAILKTRPMGRRQGAVRDQARTV